MRIRTTRSLPLCLLALITAVFFGQSAFGWQDEDGRVGVSHGRVDLSPPEGAENQDADGGAKLLQVGDRSAIHVNVSGLAPGATYDVMVNSGDESGTIGSITTRDGGVSPSRCYTGRLASPEEPEVIPEEPAGEDADGEGAGEDVDDAVDDAGELVRRIESTAGKQLAGLLAARNRRRRMTDDSSWRTPDPTLRSRSCS